MPRLGSSDLQSQRVHFAERVKSVYFHHLISNTTRTNFFFAISSRVGHNALGAPHVAQ